MVGGMAMPRWWKAQWQLNGSDGDGNGNGKHGGNGRRDGNGRCNSNGQHDGNAMVMTTTAMDGAIATAMNLGWLLALLLAMQLVGLLFSLFCEPICYQNDFT